MSNLIVVTNRKIACEPFERRIERLAKLDISKIILREKDLSSFEYYSLAKRVIKICEAYGASLMIHTYDDVARNLGYSKIHMSVASLERVKDFSLIGASCHSLGDVRLAEESSANYITFGHVFPTDCKRDLAPRGLGKLSNICNNSELPVYAIGGMTPDRYKEVLAAGAKGCCIMSSAMNTDNVEKLIDEFNEVEKAYNYE